MEKTTLPDGDWIIRVIVTGKNNIEIPQFIRCRIKNGVIPSEGKTISYLAKREGYEEGTNYYIKGISPFIEDIDAARFPDIME